MSTLTPGRGTERCWKIRTAFSPISTASATAASRALGRVEVGTAPRRIIDKGRDWVIKEMKASGLRGRGGAGFPTGLKWSFMPKNIDPKRPHYLVINADEVRAGHLQGPRDHAQRPAHAGRRRPDRLLRDGRAGRYIYFRGEYILEREHLQQAVDEAYEAKLIGKDNVHGWPFDLYVHHGAGRLHLRRRDGDARIARRQEGHAAHEAAVPGRTWASTAARSTVNNVEFDRGRARPSSPRRLLVLEFRRAQQCRHEALLHFRATSTSRATSKRRCQFRSVN